MRTFKLQSARVLSVLSVLTVLLNATPSTAQYRHNDIEAAIQRARAAGHQPAAPRPQVDPDDQQGLAGVMRENYEEEQRLLKRVSGPLVSVVKKVGKKVEDTISTLGEKAGNILDAIGKLLKR